MNGKDRHTFIPHSFLALEPIGPVMTVATTIVTRARITPFGYIIAILVVVTHATHRGLCAGARIHLACLICLDTFTTLHTGDSRDKKKRDHDRQ